MRNIKQLWSLLKGNGNYGENEQSVSNIDPNQINDYLAIIVTDPDYDRGTVVKVKLRAPTVRRVR